MTYKSNVKLAYPIQFSVLEKEQWQEYFILLDLLEKITEVVSVVRLFVSF